MKKQIFSIILVFLFSSASVFAQQNHGMKQGQNIIPNLTEEQQRAIDEINLASQKEVFPLFLQIAELETQINTLMTAEEVDMNAVNALIDKISAIRTDIQKKKMKKHNDVRNLLNEEQRLAFDMHFVQSHKEGHGNSHAKGQKYHGHNSGCGQEHQGQRQH